MTWTYTSPSSSTRDEVRFLIGDTSSTDPQLTNEEIDYILTKRSNAALAAVMCCEALIAKYTRLVTQSVGSISVSYSDRVKQYRDLISSLRSRVYAAPYAGGITVDDKDTNAENEDLVQPQFTVGQFDRTV